VTFGTIPHNGRPHGSIRNAASESVMVASANALFAGGGGIGEVSAAELSLVA